MRPLLEARSPGAAPHASAIGATPRWGNRAVPQLAPPSSFAAQGCSLAVAAVAAAAAAAVRAHASGRARSRGLARARRGRQYGQVHGSVTCACAPRANPLSTPNRFWEWRGQRVRYQALGKDQEGPSVLLVHGLFVNADHWRRNMSVLADAGFRVFAIDLLGCGYSSKPAPCGEEARAVNGENGRDLSEPEVELGTSDGGRRLAKVALRHPLGSVYNFYTWSEQLCDFAEQVICAERVTLVCNSIGSISSLQAAVDRPELVNGVMLVSPNFRELHAAESPAAARPFVSLVQALLRETPVGKALFDACANPATVKTILKVPYCDTAQVTDELVEVLLTPLLTEGAAEVVFDSLSYSAGPLPEQLLQDPRLKAPVWVCWGEEDPWTPSKRVLGLERFEAVKRVIPLPGVGHCPQDEAPGLVNPLIVDFVRQVTAPTAG